MKTTVIKHSKLVLAFCLTIVFFGCTTLEENPDFTTQDNFFKTAEQLELGVNAVYDGIGSGHDGWSHFYNRFVFENIVGYQVGWEKGPLDFQTGNINPGDEYIRTYWRISYEYINRANAVIAKANELIEAGVPNTALIERVRGEALFLRAFYYYNLVRYFDNIPVTTDPTTSDEDLPSNENGKRKALDLIQSDLKLASSLLPENHEAENLGRATKWAAETLLMKAYLQDEKWCEALTTAEDIMDQSDLYLFDDFSKNFAVETENSGERIFEAQVSASANNSEGSSSHAHFKPADLPNELGGQGWHWLNGTKAFRMKYDPGDKRIPGTFISEYPSTRVGRNSSGEWPIVRWSPDAPYNLSRYGGLVPADADPNNPEELIFANAWVDKHTEVGISNASLTEKNTVYLRYADVLLGHSEAANECGSGDPYLGINMVRQRAGLPLLSGLSQSELRDAIVNEFVLEFAFEQDIYPFLKRKSTFGGSPDYLGDYIKEFIDTYDVDRTVAPTDYVLPIPLNEVQGNPNVSQNPVYQ